MPGVPEMTADTASAGEAKTLMLAENAGIANVADLQVALTNLLEAEGAGLVEVDCSAVRSIDAAVLQCLLVNSRLAVANGKRLRVMQPSADFQRIAAYVGLVEEFGAT